MLLIICTVSSMHLEQHATAAQEIYGRRKRDARQEEIDLCAGRISAEGVFVHGAGRLLARDLLTLVSTKRSVDALAY